MFKLFSVSIIFSILITLSTLFIPYYDSCDFINIFPCGDVRGFPIQILNEKCVKNCISMTPDNPDAIFSWVAIEGWESYFLLNTVFWLPASLILIYVINNKLSKNSKKGKPANKLQ